MSCFAVNGTATEKRPPPPLVCALPSCLPDPFRTSTVSFPERPEMPLTVIGLRHCEFGTGVLTVIGDLAGSETVEEVVAVDASFEDEQAVAQRTSAAATTRRATAPSPAGSLVEPRGMPGAGRRSLRARRRRAFPPAR